MHAAGRGVLRISKCLCIRLTQWGESGLRSGWETLARVPRGHRSGRRFRYPRPHPRFLRDDDRGIGPRIGAHAQIHDLVVISLQWGMSIGSLAARSARHDRRARTPVLHLQAIPDWRRCRSRTGWFREVLCTAGISWFALRIWLERRLWQPRSAKLTHFPMA